MGTSSRAALPELSSRQQSTGAPSGGMRWGKQPAGSLPGATVKTPSEGRPGSDWVSTKQALPSLPGKASEARITACQRNCQVLSSSSSRLDSKELGTGRQEREESRAKEQKESGGSGRCEMSQHPGNFGRKSQASGLPQGLRPGYSPEMK